MSTGCGTSKEILGHCYSDEEMYISISQIQIDKLSMLNKVNETPNFNSYMKYISRCK